MRFIGDFKVLCEGGDVHGYLERKPPAVMLYHSAEMGLGTVSGMPGNTRNRLVLEDHPARRLPGNPSKEEAYIVFLLEPKSGPLGRRLVLGCSSTCDVFINDASISRKHAVVEIRENDYYLQDNGSTAGTWINGVRLKKDEWKLLTSGDKLAFGSISMVFMMPREFYNFVIKYFGHK